MFLPEHMATTYDQIVILGDLNVGTEGNRMDDFCNSYGTQSLIKEATWYKNSESLSCIDLIVNKVSRRFQPTCVIKTRLPGFHINKVKYFEKNFKKLRPKHIFYNYISSILHLTVPRLFPQVSGTPTIRNLGRGGLYQQQESNKKTITLHF